MMLRKEKDWELWDGCHPYSFGCKSEGREVCDCKYHLVNKETSEILSFDSYKEVAASFKEKTGVEAFSIK